MFLIRFVRWFFGIVRFSLTGPFPERFLNLSANRDILLWDIKRKDGLLQASVRASDYKKLRPLARKTKMRMRMTAKTGFPFRTRGYKKRYGFLVGAALFAISLFTLSQFIWTVEVRGNREVDTQSILLALEEIGVDIGTFKASLTPALVEQQLMLRIPRISRVAIIQKGSSMVVEVREGMRPDVVVPSNEPCHLLSGRAGVLLYVETYTGQAVKQKGEAVAEGSIVISGIVEDKEGNSTFVHAAGKIMAETEYTLAAEVPYEQQIREKAGRRKTVRVLNFFSIPIPLSFGKAPAGDYEKQYAEKKLFNLPVSLQTTVYDLVELRTETITEEEAQEKALRQLNLMEEKELSRVEIIGKNVQQFAENDKYKVVADYKCTENIAVEQKIEINR